LTDAARLETELARLFGDVASLALLPKRKAVVEFARLASAVKAVDASGRPGTLLEGVTVTWLAGEPEVVRAARARGAAPAATSTPPPQAKVPAAAPLDEDAVLAKMRDQQRRRTERERLEAEIRRQDEEEEARIQAGR
jgi:hypothetical protein